MDPIEKLTVLFERFPGIGPRQAGRFVQYLLRSSPTMRRDFVDAVQALGGKVVQCDACMRFHAGDRRRCSICANPERDQSALVVVASDADLAAIERSGTFAGRYFVLGGTISLASESTQGLRLQQLMDSIRQREGLSEVILALPANPEGDATAQRVREELASSGLHVTMLGRGLSTGSELEYADPETIKSAIDSRK